MISEHISLNSTHLRDELKESDNLMYTLFTAIGLGVLGAAFSTFWCFFNPHNSTWFLRGVIGFVWINRRVGKRVEALTFADAELANISPLPDDRCKS